MVAVQGISVRHAQAYDLAGEAFTAAMQVLETAPDAGIALAASEIVASALKADSNVFLLVDNARLKDVDANGTEL